MKPEVKFGLKVSAVAVALSTGYRLFRAYETGAPISGDAAYWLAYVIGASLWGIPAWYWMRHNRRET